MHCERSLSFNPHSDVFSTNIGKNENPRQAIVDSLVSPLDASGRDSFFYDLKDLLSSFSTEELKTLSRVSDFLTSSCCNHYRFKIFRLLKGIALSEWTPLLSEWQKMMPPESRGHDLFRAMRILCGISESSQREKIATLCASLFKEGMPSLERCYILEGISKLDPVALSDLDQSSEEIKTLSARIFVPDSIRKGNQKAPYVPYLTRDIDGIGVTNGTITGIKQIFKP